LKLIVGLGNPGERYAETRHNIGFMVAEQLARRFRIALKRKGFQGLYGAGHILGQEVTILLPQTYMNRSGSSVASALQSLGIQPGDLIVVHDEIDLEYGALRVKVGGGHGGHNGLRDLASSLQDPHFVRLRVGVGRPPAGGDVSNHVLSRFNAEERSKLDDIVSFAVDAIERILLDGPTAAMNAYNNRNLLSESI
jgi:PTH1 family peptidyl-tRNA hydrolase